MKKVYCLTLAFLLILATQGFAQQEDAQQKKSADEIAKELANPNNSLANLAFKNQFRWYTGDLPHADDQQNYTLLFQPVFPFALAPKANGGKQTLFIRPAFPFLVDQPVFDAGKLDFDGVSAMGDIGFDITYGVTEKSGLLWALGMVGTLPTATDSDVAGEQLRLGPEVLLAKFYKWGLLGLFPSHQWNIAGWDDSSFSTSQLQLFLKFLPGGGWSVGTGPIINYDWETESWTIPLNLGVSKTVMFGSLPVKLEWEGNYYVDQPDTFGPEWMLGFNIRPVVPNIFEKWLKHD